jgi:hypothetical protein
VCVAAVGSILFFIFPLSERAVNGDGKRYNGETFQWYFSAVESFDGSFLKMGSFNGNELIFPKYYFYIYFCKGWSTNLRRGTCRAGRIVWYGWPTGGPFSQPKVSPRPLNLTRAEVVCDNSMHAAVLRPFFFNSKNYAYLYEYIYINRVFMSNQELKIGWTVSNQLRHSGLV